MREYCQICDANGLANYAVSWRSCFTFLCDSCYRELPGRTSCLKELCKQEFDAYVPSVSLLDVPDLFEERV